MKVKEESKNIGLKLNIQKTKIVASGPITSWQIDGETVETVGDFIFGAPKSLLMVIADMKLKTLTRWKERPLCQIKVLLVKGMVFPVVMYGCESWTVKKTECQRIGAFELWCWRRLLRVPWTARRSNQSILKEINPGISLQSKGLSRVFSSTTVQKHQFFGAQPSSQSNSHIHT